VDDVIIYGKTLFEHDKSLVAVLDILHESGQKNENKRKFRLPQLTFFRYGLSKRKVIPSEETIANIQNSEPPKTASDAKSFMCFVQYSAKFISDLGLITGQFKI